VIDRVLPGFPAGTPEPVIAAVLDDVRRRRGADEQRAQSATGVVSDSKEVK
jgi:hypothetical protein